MNRIILVCLILCVFSSCAPEKPKKVTEEYSSPPNITVVEPETPKKPIVDDDGTYKKKNDEEEKITIKKSELEHLERSLKYSDLNNQFLEFQLNTLVKLTKQYCPDRIGYMIEEYENEVENYKKYLEAEQRQQNADDNQIEEDERRRQQENLPKQGDNNDT